MGRERLAEASGMLLLLISEFGVTRPWLADPEQVRDRCDKVSGEFARLCADRGLPAKVVSGMRFGEIPEFPGTEVVLGGHFAVSVGTSVIDWTARQFDPCAQVPVVVSLGEWRKVWRGIAATEPPAQSAASG
jgi:hypothetical protein